MAEPTTQYSVTSNIPEWAKEYATKLLGRAEGLTEPIYDPKTGLYTPQYTPYGGRLVAGFNPLQEQAMRDVARMDVAPEMGQATGFTGLAALQAQNLGQYNPFQPRQFYRSPMQRPGMIQSYMSPYMQGVVEQQKSQAVQDYRRQIPGMGAAAARVGGRGGTREALLQAEGQRNLNEQLQNIQATGLQNAFQQAQQQAAQDAQLRAQYGLAGAQLGEESRQFGANLGFTGLQQPVSKDKTWSSADSPRSISSSSTSSRLRIVSLGSCRTSCAVRLLRRRRQTFISNRLTSLPLRLAVQVALPRSLEGWGDDRSSQRNRANDDDFAPAGHPERDAA